MADLVDGQRDQPGGGLGLTGCGGGNCEERVDDHRGQGPTVPGGPAADLVLVEGCEFLVRLEVVLDGPADPRDPDERGQRDRGGAVAR